MFVLNGRPLPLDTPFEANGTLYPANWLRLASPAERAAAGITEQPNPARYDQRFYWGWSTSGTLIPKDHADLVTLWSDTTRHTANSFLAPSDWEIIREMDNGTPVASGLKAWRQDIRYACEGKITMIDLTQTTDELAQYITYVSPSGGAPSDYNSWPQYDPTPAPAGVAADEPVVVDEPAAPVVDEPAAPAADEPAVTPSGDAV